MNEEREETIAPMANAPEVPANANAADTAAAEDNSITPVAMPEFDPFAAQNAVRAEKESVWKKRRKMMIIAGIVAAVVLIPLVVFSVINLLQSESDTSEIDQIDFADGDTSTNIQQLNTLAQNAFKPQGIANVDGQTTVEGDLSAAEAIFDTAAKKPANKDYASQIYLAEMMFFINGGYYDKAIAMIQKINPDQLATEQKSLFYSYASMSYYYLENEEEYNRYRNLNWEIQKNMEGYGG